MIEKREISILLKNLRFFSRIGVYEQERLIGNEFEVNATIRYDAIGFKTEQLDSTISYAEIYDEIAKVMQKEMLLLETAAQEICEVVASKWKAVKLVRAEITKLAVPIKGIQGECSVEYLLERPRVHQNSLAQ